MKTLNNIFSAIYSIVLIASVWFGINWTITRGINSMFDDSAEFIFAVLYIVALAFSIFMHIKLRNEFSVANKICTVVTSINVISLIALTLVAFNSISSDAGLFLATWMFAVLGLWLVSLISGITALRRMGSATIK